MISQDPYESLNPGRNVYDIIAQAIRFHNLASDWRKEAELVKKFG